MISPTNRTRSEAITGRGGQSAPCVARCTMSGPQVPSRSAAVKVATTLSMRPLATGLRTNATCRQPSGSRSSTNRASPRSRRGSSKRRRLWPIGPVPAMSLKSPSSTHTGWRSRGVTSRPTSCSPAATFSPSSRRNGSTSTSRWRTAVVADPHEVANVLGTDGIHWLLDCCDDLPLDVFVMASSCVPASQFESPRRPFTTGDIESLLRRKRTIGVAEMMNFPGVIAGRPGELAKLETGLTTHVDGHAPGVSLVLDDLESFRPRRVLKRGAAPQFVKVEVPEWVRQPVNIAPVGEDSFRVAAGPRTIRVMRVIPAQLLTGVDSVEPAVSDGCIVADPDRDLVKIAVVERHHASGRVGVGFATNVGLRRGAFGSTVAHDAHNIVLLGVDDGDMAACATRLAEIGGGIVVAEGGRVMEELPLPVAGLMSDRPLAEVHQRLRSMEARLKEMGVGMASPFMTLSFLALSVIPELKITDRGLVDVGRFELVPLGID